KEAHRFVFALRRGSAARRWRKGPPSWVGSREMSHGGEAGAGAAKELTEVVQGGAPLLLARPPGGHLHRRRSRSDPRSAATPELAPQSEYSGGDGSGRLVQAELGRESNTSSVAGPGRCPQGLGCVPQH